MFLIMLHFSKLGHPYRIFGDRETLVCLEDSTPMDGSSYFLFHFTECVEISQRFFFADWRESAGN
jgi:hypothetical protein